MGQTFKEWEKDHNDRMDVLNTLLDLAEKEPYNYDKVQSMLVERVKDGRRRRTLMSSYNRYFELLEKNKVNEGLN